MSAFFIPYSGYRMMHRYLLIGLLSLLCTYVQSLQADTGYHSQNVVYHINYSDQKRISATLNNITNHVQALENTDSHIKAVVHGRAIEYFIDAIQDSSKQIILDTLRLNDVQFIICGNTLNNYHLTQTDLYEVESEDVVKAALPEIIHLQQQGYFYVRP